MTIGIDVRLITKQKTGIGKYAFWLLTEILRTDKNNRYYLYGYGNEDLGQLLDLDNVIYRVIHFRLLDFLPRIIMKVIWEQVVFPAEMMRDSVEVLYSPWFDVPVFALYSRLKVVLTIHDLAFLQRKEGKLIFRFYYKLLVKIAAKRCLRIVTDSEFSRSDILHILGVPTEKILVIYNLCFLSLGQVESIDKYGDILSFYRIRKPYILYTGGIAPRKNIHLLLEGFYMFCRAGFEGQLVITGSRELPVRLRSSVHWPDLWKQVCLTGYVPDSHLKTLYQNAILSVYPSLYEGYGLPVLESMALGTPVVCSDVSSLPEIVGDAAPMFNPYSVEQFRDKLLELCDDEGARNEYKIRGYKRIRYLVRSQAKKDFSIVTSYF